MDKTYFKNSVVNLFIIFILFFITSVYSQDKSREVPNRVKNIVQDVVGKTGNTYIAQGSWINPNKTFRPGSSDMDLESFVFNKPKPTDPSKVAAWEKDLVDTWKKSQSDLIDGVKEKAKGIIAYKYPGRSVNDLPMDEIDAEAKKMLGKINVYPPADLMGDVRDGKEAMDKFKKYGVVPNLGAVDDINTGKIGGVGDLNTKEMTDAAEGLYGKDAKRWIAVDRAKAGNSMVIYKDPNTGKSMASRFTDLEHGMIGGKTFTTQGSANLGSQFIDKIFDDIRGGDMAKAKKSLDRLKDELQILKNKSGVKIDISEVDDLIKSGNIGKAKDILAGAKLQCELLKYGNTPAKLSMIEKLLVKGGKASEKLMDLLSKVPAGKILSVVDGVMKTFQAIQMGADISKGDYAKALVDLGLALSPAVISILGTMTQEMLEAAKELGIRLASGRQECFDMLSGIYPDNPAYVVGSQSPDVSMEMLLLKYAADESQKLAALISGRATQSSDKPDVAAANEVKCLAQVIPAWKEARASYGEAFKELAMSLAFDIKVKIKEPEKKDLKQDIAQLESIKKDFDREYNDAEKNADRVQRYATAFQNAIGAQDANPCRNPMIAYLWRQVNRSFELYSKCVKRMAELEFKMRAKIGPLRDKINAMKEAGDVPIEGKKDITAAFAYNGISFNDLKQRLDAYAKFVCAEGGYTTYNIDWYLDGDDKGGYSESIEVKEVEPGPHIIEAKFVLFPFGPKDNSMEGLSYRAELFSGAQFEIPQPTQKDPQKESEELLLKLKVADEEWLAQMSSQLTDHMNRTGILGDLVIACNDQIRSYGCDKDELDRIGRDFADDDKDPDDLINATREICGDGLDNNGNGLIDEDCSGGGTVTITVWDSGSVADDSFSLSVTGYGNLGSTPAGGQRIYRLNLPSGSYTATLTCVLAPDNAGTYSISFSGSASGGSGSGSFSNAGDSAGFPFVVK